MLIYMWQITWESDSRRPRHPGEPSMTKNSSSSRARKIRAPRDSTPLGRVRKMAQNAPKRTQISLQILSMSEPLAQASTTLFKNCCGTTGMSSTLSRELNRARTVRLDCWNKRCMITATSTTPQELHLRQFHSFLHCLYQHLSLHKTGTTTRSLSLCSNWNSHHSVDELKKHQRLLESVLHDHRDAHNRNVSHRRGGQYFYPAQAWR